MINIWDRLRTSFWFVPCLMAAVAVALSFGLVEVDIALARARDTGEGFGFGPEGARAILSAIASSMITVAGLTFSITMLTLQLASSQFGPRMMRNFMRDRGNQVVLGTFIATFLYCLLVLRAVRGTETAHFVPQVSVAFGIVLVVASLAVLIYFIHHIAVSIRIETILAVLADETREAIDRLYPVERGARTPEAGDVAECDTPIPPDFDARAYPVLGLRSGYVQSVDYETLVRIACECDVVLRVDKLPGSFAAESDRILSVYGRDKVPDKLARRLRGALILGAARTPQQDLGYSIRRIVEIAQRSLSPGINDPTTALYCIDRLGEALARLAAREVPPPWHRDDDGRLRVITEEISFDRIACPAFDAIARYGGRDADVIARLAEAMDRASNAAEPGCAAILAGMKEKILAECASPNGRDRAGVALPT